MENLLDQKLSSYFTRLTEAEKKSLLLMLKTFLAGRSAIDEPINIEQYNKEIDEALAEVEMQNYVSQEDMEKQAAKW